MTIEFDCPYCGKTLKTADDKAGARATCPDCGAGITVPADGGVLDLDEEMGGGARGDTKECPACGETIKGAAIRCRFCGTDIGPGTMPYHVKPHRGVLILVFGILSVVMLTISCPVFGIVAWVVGNQDIAEMQAGRMDPEGLGMTKAGKILGIVSLALVALGILGYCGFMMLFVGLGVAAG